MDITTGTLVSGGLLVSAGLGILYSLKNIPTLLWKKLQSRFIYNVTIYDYDELYTVLEYWLYHNHSNKYRDTEAGYNILDNSILNSFPAMVTKESGKRVNLQYKQGIDIFIINYKNKKLFFSKAKEKLENAELEQINEYLTSFYGKEFYLGEAEISIPMAAAQEICMKNMDNPDGAIQEIIEYNKDKQKQLIYDKDSMPV